VTDDNGAFVFSGVARGTHAVYREEPGKRSEWLRMATVTVAETDVSLGVIGSTMADLHVVVNAPESADSAWQIAQVFITDREEAYAAPLRRAQRPASDDVPWTIENVESGTYFLTVVRRDQLRWRRRITLVADQGPWEISIDLPETTARVSGHVRGATPGWLALWQAGHRVWKTVQLADDGTFAVEDLPAGSYVIGSDAAFTAGMPVMAEFTLEPGQDRHIDISVVNAADQTRGFLIVHVADERGRLRDDARVRLEGQSHTIEPRVASGGLYSFFAPVQPHTVHVEVSGYDKVTRPVTLEPFEASSSKRQSVLIRFEGR
jgi:hypothetical protein